MQQNTHHEHGRHPQQNFCGNAQNLGGDGCWTIFATLAQDLAAMGYSPMPRIIRDGQGRPAIKGWSDLCGGSPTERDLEQWTKIPGADVALACGYGGLLAIDVDSDDEEILKAVTATLPHCTVARRGSKGFALLCRHADGPQRSANVYASDDSRKSPLVEVMGLGRNITIPPSRHAKTDKAYRWIDPATSKPHRADWRLPPFKELPVIANEDLECLREALAPWSRKPKPPRPKADGQAPVLNSATEKRYHAYARAGLERATAKLAALTEGRPSELFRSVCALGWSVANDALGEAEFTAAYVNACRENGLLARDGQRAIEASIHSGLEKAANDPLPHLQDREPDKRLQAAETQEPDSRPDSLQHIVASMPDLEEDVEQLARLKILDYDRMRKTEAQRLGVSVSALDDAVKRKRACLVSSLEPEAWLDEALEPWPAPVDGSQLLLALIEALRAHVILPEHAYLPVALWILHAHAHGAAAISPILAIISPERRCGKTTLLSLLQELTPKALLAANITAAAVFRAIEMWRPTLLVDEADTFLAEREELRGVINSGHNRRSAVVIRVVEENGEQVPKKFSTWAPKAIAQIKDLPDTLQDRSVAIRLRRKLPGEKVARFRADRTQHLTEINRRAARWAQDNLDALREMDAETPPRLHDRAADNWRSLFVIAKRIGGEWPEKTRIAALAVEGVDAEVGEETEPSDGVRLLADCKAVFEARGATELSVRDIINDLCDADESHWSDYRAGKSITEKAFANLLKPFGITSKMGTAGSGKGKKFWRKVDFRDAWKRYLPANDQKSGDPSSTPSTSLRIIENSAWRSSTTVEDHDKEKANKINNVEGVELQSTNFPLSAEGMPAQRRNRAIRPEADLEAEVLI
jgi:putative DNA primase/helicase